MVVVIKRAAGKTIYNRESNFVVGVSDTLVPVGTEDASTRPDELGQRVWSFLGSMLRG